MQDNTTYIETTMGNSVVGTNTNSTRDHFWDVGSNEDGRHRFFQSLGFTVGGVAADPVVGTGMDGVIYLREVLGRIQGFYRNNSGGLNNGIYQFIPAYIIGTMIISGGGSGDWVTLSAVPSGSYGEIYMFKDSDLSLVQFGNFSTSIGVGANVRAYSSRIKQNGVSDDYMIELRNDGSSGLNIQARRGDSGSGFDGIWNYRITYRSF